MSGLLHDPERLAAALEEAGLDALVATQPPGVRYLTRFGKAGAGLAVVTRAEPARPVLLIPAVEIDYLVEDLVPGTAVHAWGDFVRELDPAAELDEAEALVAAAHAAREPGLDRAGSLARALARLGLGAARIGLDVPPALEPALVAALPRVPVDASAILPRLRTVKTPLEVERLREAVRMTEAAISATAAVAAAGVTVAELSAAFRASVAREGGLLRVDSVSVGRATVFGNANVPHATLEPGGLLRFDVGAVHRGYQSDLSRTFALGEPGAKAARYARAVIEGQSAALDLLRPGMRTAELFEAAVRATRAAGIPHYERTHVGHGIGLVGGGYDAPLLAPGDRQLVRAGMVLCVETPYYELGFGGVQIEDMVLVTETGWEPLSLLPRELGVLA